MTPTARRFPPPAIGHAIQKKPPKRDFCHWGFGSRFSGFIMYRIYVTLKSGNQATGLELCKGSPPASGTELDVPLIRGGSVQARIGSTTDTKRIGGDSILVVAEVQGDEI